MKNCFSFRILNTIVYNTIAKLADHDIIMTLAQLSASNFALFLTRAFEFVQQAYFYTLDNFPGLALFTLLVFF